MMLRLYMDAHVHSAITKALRQRGIDVITAQEDGTDTLPDADLLTHASSRGFVLVSQDEDLLAEAADRQRSLQNFSGLLYAHQLNVTIATCVADLELAAKLYEPHELQNRVVYIPLR